MSNTLRIVTIEREINGETVRIPLTMNEMQDAANAIRFERFRELIRGKLEDRGILDMASAEDIETAAEDLNDEYEWGDLNTQEDEVVENIVEKWFPAEDYEGEDDEEGGDYYGI